MFMSVWIPPSYSANGASYNWYDSSDYNGTDNVTMGNRMAISHTKVMFGIHGTRQTPEDIHDLVGSKTNKLRYTVGPTSNVGSYITNPDNKRIVCSEEEKFTFTIWTRKMNAQDHSTVLRDGTSRLDGPAGPVYPDEGLGRQASYNSQHGSLKNLLRKVIR